jgi:hypothetical protein
MLRDVSRWQAESVAEQTSLIVMRQVQESMISGGYRRACDRTFLNFVKTIQRK